MLQHDMTDPTCMNTRRPKASLARVKNGTANSAKPRDANEFAPETRAYCVTADLHVHDNAMLGSHLSVLTPAHSAPANQSTAIKDVFPERNPFPTERRNAHEYITAKNLFCDGNFSCGSSSGNGSRLGTAVGAGEFEGICVYAPRGAWTNEIEWHLWRIYQLSRCLDDEPKNACALHSPIGQCHIPMVHQMMCRGGAALLLPDK